MRETPAGRHVVEDCGQVGYKKEEERTKQTWACSSVKMDSESRVFTCLRKLVLVQRGDKILTALSCGLLLCQL